MKSRLLGLARYLIAGLVIYWLVSSGAVNLNVLRRSVTAFDVMLIAFVILLLDLAVTSWRLVILLAGRGFQITLLDALRLTLVGNLFNLVLPAGGGDVARFYYASANAVGRRTELAAVLVFDRLIGLITLLALPAMMLPFIFDTVSGSAAITSLFQVAGLTAIGLTGGLALIMIPARGIPAPLTWILTRLPMASNLTRFVDTIRGYRERPLVLLRAALLSLAAHAMSGLVIAVVHSVNGGFVTYAGVVSLLGFVANSLPLTPGGLGVGEAAFGALFREAGLTGGAEALLSWRVLLLALAPIGLVIHLRGLRVSLAAPGR
jgi:hypothetical protein